MKDLHIWHGEKDFNAVAAEVIRSKSIPRCSHVKMDENTIDLGGILYRLF
jgi:hypothetical protein